MTRAPQPAPEPSAGAETDVGAEIGSAAGAVGLALTAEQVERLVAFIRLLQRWNTTYNLTAVRDPAQMLVQHLFDCLAVVEPLRRHARGLAGKRLLDVGSGGGFPGAVLAIVEPALAVVCVDSVGKKTAFIAQAAAELGLSDLRSVHARVEEMQAEPFDIVVSRAYASLAGFTRSSRRMVSSSGIWMAMKGKEPVDEILELPADINVFHVEHLNVPGLDADRCLVWMKPLH